MREPLSLGALCALILRANAAFEEDPISQETGMWDLRFIRRIVRHACYEAGYSSPQAVLAELDRRGVSPRWRYFNGLDTILEEAGNLNRERVYPE